MGVLKKVYNLENFDSLFHTEASIKADTAYYYNKKRVVEADRKCTHTEPERRKNSIRSCCIGIRIKKRVYSDQRVRIEQPDQIIYAIGFESNEQLTKYRFFKTEGIFYVDEDSVTPF